MEESLPDAVERKIDKHYAKPDDAKLVLVVYHSWAGIAYRETEPYERSRNLLAQGKHPFDEVWYFVPLAGDVHGCPVQIWPPDA